MATHAPITGAPTRASAFRLNGCTNPVDEPYPFLDQAHALACCLEEAVSDEASMNSDILQAAARGIATLIQLAAEGLSVMDRTRSAADIAARRSAGIEARAGARTEA